MTETSIPEFVSSLEKSRLLTEAQIKLLRKQLVGNPLTASGLADVLISQNHLSEWQAKQLLKGQSGFVLNQYRLLNPIGRGGMGHVFRGLDARSNTVVAVKVMAKKLVSNQTLVSRFRREIRASSKLSSPHIVRTLDAGRVGKVDFMVMEYVNGDQVDCIANRLGRLPAGLACDIIRQAADGLQHAHEHQMVHRDIKPSNIMVHWEESGEGIVKLMDMGLVLLMEDNSDEKTVTRAGQVMGTPDYMSPEQGWDTTKVDIRSDIYSLGCTLFRLLTGTVPFSGSNPLQVLSQRLQRDAPSVQTVCDDIPDEIAAIVSRMTARDPEARYQQPADVVRALDAVSKTLTLSSLKSAVRKATNDPEAEISPSDTDDSANHDIDESDGTYRQFLKEVQDGSSVDLMFATDTGDSPSTATIPEFDLKIKPPSERRKDRSHAINNSRRPTIVIAGVAILGIVGAGFILSSNDSTDPPLPSVADPPQDTIPATAKLKKTEIPAAVAGETWSHTVEMEIEGATGPTRYQLSDSAPPDMEIDPATGKIAWPIPLSQTPGPYTAAFVLLHEHNGTEVTLAEESLVIDVESGFASLRLPQHNRPFPLPVKTPFTLSMQAKPKDNRAGILRYAADTKPPGLTIDAQSGLLKWTPQLSDFGRHELTISVCRQDRPKEKLTSELKLLVVPTEISQLLPAMPQQSAKAGETFRYSLPEPGLRRPGKRFGKLVVMPAPGGPDGVTIDRQKRELVWNVPKDASGEVRVPLIARLEMGETVNNINLNGKAVLRINVAAMPVKTDPPKDSGLSATEVAETAEKLKKTFARSIAQARSAADKALLASRLLEQSYSGTAGLPDAALLKLIEEEIALRAKATDVLLEIGRLRAQRYGDDELAAAANTLESFRKTGLTPKQQDVVVEHCLRLAKDSIAAEKFPLAKTLLETVNTILGRGSQGVAGQLSADVSAAAGIATELVKETDRTASAIQVAELARLIDRWQFTPFFQDTSALAYAQFSSAGRPSPLANSGRSLWAVNKGAVRLKSDTEDAVIAVIDRTQPAARYVLRFEIGPKSNCTQLLFALDGTDSTDLNAVRLNLNSSGLGQMHGLRNSIAMNDVKRIVTPTIFADQCNLVELLVDGSAVALRVNGTAVTQTDIPGLRTGRLALAADLRRSAPQVDVRHPRILLLPNTD